MNGPIIDVEPKPDDLRYKWVQMRGVLMGLRQGATVGLRLPPHVSIELARGVIPNLESKYGLYNNFKSKKDPEQHVLWVTRIAHSTPNLRINEMNRQIRLIHKTG